VLLLEEKFFLEEQAIKTLVTDLASGTDYGLQGQDAGEMKGIRQRELDALEKETKQIAAILKLGAACPPCHLANEWPACARFFN